MWQTSFFLCEDSNAFTQHVSIDRFLGIARSSRTWRSTASEYSVFDENGNVTPVEEADSVLGYRSSVSTYQSVVRIADNSTGATALGLGVSLHLYGKYVSADIEGDDNNMQEQPRAQQTLENPAQFTLRAPY